MKKGIPNNYFSPNGDHSGNASNPDPQAYIEKLRGMTISEKSAEIVYLRQKMVSATDLQIEGLMEYYSKVHCWLSLVLGHEINVAVTERLDTLGENGFPFT